MFAWMLTVGAFAQSVVIEIDPLKAQDLSLDAGSVADGLSGRISALLKSDSPEAYLAQFAEADAIALKGMGVDYATNPKVFSIGATIGTGVAGGPFRVARGPNDLPDSGFATMASIHGGVRVGALLPGKGLLDRLTVYANGLTYTPPSDRSFAVTTYNLGVHAQLQALKPMSLGLVEWGGLALTGGFERSVYELSLAQGLPVQQSVQEGVATSSAGTATVTWDGAGNYTLSARADTVPLEASTNLRVFFVTVFGGAAADFRGATASISANMSGPVDGDDGGGPVTLGSGALTIDARGAAEAMAIRYFGGIQLNAGPAKLYGHLNVAEESVGGFMGVRLAM